MEEALQDENRRIRRLRLLVDLALDYIGNQTLTHDEALGIVEGIKRHAITLFPGKEEAFNIIYAPRFKRLLNSKFRRS
jgi:hypothetical protein